MRVSNIQINADYHKASLVTDGGLAKDVLALRGVAKADGEGGAALVVRCGPGQSCDFRYHHLVVWWWSIRKVLISINH